MLATAQRSGQTAKASAAPVQTLSARAKTAVLALAFQPEHRLVFAGSRDRIVRAYDDSTLEAQGALAPTHFDHIRCLALAGSFLYSGGGDAAGFLKRWNVGEGAARTGQIPFPVSVNAAHKEGIQGATASAPSPESARSHGRSGGLMQP